MRGVLALTVALFAQAMLATGAFGACQPVGYSQPQNVSNAVMQEQLATICSPGKTSPVSVTRPANTTAYSGNDVVYGALTFAGLGAATGGETFITSAELEIDVSAIPSGMTGFTLYLYSSTPPSAYSDNAAWDLPSGDRSVFLGSINLGTPVDLGSTLYVRTDGINAQFTVPNGGTLYGYLVTTGGYTPAANSEVYKVTLHAAGL